MDWKRGTGWWCAIVLACVLALGGLASAGSLPLRVFGEEEQTTEEESGSGSEETETSEDDGSEADSDDGGADADSEDDAADAEDGSAEDDAGEVADAEEDDDTDAGDDAESESETESEATEDATDDESDDEGLEKVETPTLEKEVYEDYEGSEGWYASADAGCGEAVAYRLTGTLPSNWDEFESYYLAFHDTPADSMSIDLESVALTLVDAETQEAVDVTDGFEATFSDGELLVACEDLKALEAFADAEYGDTVVCTYTATLSYELVTTGTSGGAQNFAWLTYTSKPYTDALGKTTEVSTEVYSWSLRLYKVSSSTGQALTGATFTVLDEATGRYVDGAGGFSDDPVELACDSDGVLAIIGIDSGRYTITEVQAPSGYTVADPFAIEVESQAQTGEPELVVTVSSTDDENSNTAVSLVSLDTAEGVVSLTVADQKTTASVVGELAQTGSWVPLVGFGLLFAGAVAMVVGARRRHGAA